MKEKKLLTKAEFQVMHILWNLPTRGAFTGDILAKYPDPKPAYTTLATFLKILTNKGFVKSIKVGTMLYFTPIVQQEDYTESYLSNVKDVFFGGSFMSLISFFTKREKLNEQEINELIEIIKQSKE